MDKIKKAIGTITGIHIETLVLNESFLDFSSRFASMSGTVILMSGGNLDCARYHILGAKPCLTFSGRGKNINISVDSQSFDFKANPFNALQQILDVFSLTNFGFDISKLPKPIASGLLGYLSYDLKDHLENLPNTSIDNLCLPHICFFAPSILVVHDKVENTAQLCILKRTKSNFENDLKTFETIFQSKPLPNGDFSCGQKGFSSNFTKSDYINAIEQIKQYIALGDVYQVNLSQRFEADFKGDSFALFKALYNVNPAPFFAYINTGDFQIVSTSPERFIMQTGNKVETRPIKGTRPRGKTSDEDKKFAIELQQSKKDDAELSMIVDLMRNDFGKVCKAGSIRVAKHKMLESYQNVYHLVSIIEGILSNGRNSVDVIKATFPGGSITGCPKISAMKIIDKLESHNRHIYTGSIGYVSFHNSMDLSIAIRTATILNGKIIFSAGGGIVSDSKPDDEYDETLHKSRTLMEVFNGKEKITINKNYIWINGAIKSEDQATVSVMDQGFLFGYGFFETIRVDDGEPKYLEEHIVRLNKTWQQLFDEKPPNFAWDEIIKQVIRKNNLAKKTAAVKIIVTKGSNDKPPFNHMFIVMARQYIHRLSGKKEAGINLAIYLEPRQTPLANHKTLNYLYYLLAGKWAKNQGADEALILNPDGTVSETNSAAILLIKDKTVTMPVSEHVLPSTMAEVVREFLVKQGFAIENKKIVPKDLFTFDDALIVNSLIGAMPILSIDRKKLKKPSDLWRKINANCHQILV